MVQQYYGTIEIDGTFCDAVLVADQDRPDEAMITWWGENVPPSAVLVHWQAQLNGGTNITLRRLYQVDNAGEIRPGSPSISATEQSQGITAELSKSGPFLRGHWRDLNGRSGSISFHEAANSEELSARQCNSWNEFKAWVSDQTAEDFIAFRGHGDRQFRLQTTLQRAGRHRLERYCSETLPEFQGHAEAVLDSRLRFSDPDDYSTLLGLAQHHGLPTPLLDWTRSPYVAAFFAFSDSLEYLSMRSTATHIRVYGLKRAFFDRAQSPKVILPFFKPYIAPLYVSPRHNPRLYSQQGLFLVTNAANVEHFLLRMAKSDGIAYLCAADVPISVATEALEDLRLMGLTAATMFPGLDGVCRMMRLGMSVNQYRLPPPGKPGGEGASDDIAR